MILEESRQGIPTAKIKNRYIHSRYSPQKEADQYFQRWIEGNDEISKLVIIEPGLGYLLNSISDRFTDDDLFIIFLSSETMEYCSRNGLLNNISYMYYSSDAADISDLTRFLYASGIRDISVLEWPAAIQLFEEESLSVKEQILKLFRIRQGNQITEKRFSKLWFRNGITNFIRNNYSKLVGTNSSPVLLCASGPSLEDHLVTIKALEGSYIIAALPSSLRALGEYGIDADIVFSTDPGYYAGEHLKYLPPKALVISPLSAFASCDSLNLMGFLQGSPFENFFFKGNELPFVTEMGTVAATAIDFLVRWKGNSNLYICGLDLCFRDIKMHASPHSFDPIIKSNESRLYPGYSLFYERAFSMTDTKKDHLRFTKSMDTYQNWFSMQSFPSSVFRLEPDTVGLNIPVVDSLPHVKGNKSFTVLNNTNYPSLEIRRNRVSDFISTLMQDLSAYKKNQEIAPLLSSVMNALSMDEVEYDTLTLLTEKWAKL